MKKRIVISVLVLLVSLFSIGSVSSQAGTPVLIAEFNSVDQVPNPYGAVSAVALMGVLTNPGVGVEDCLDVVGMHQAMGCESGPIPLGTQGATFDFDATNTTDWIGLSNDQFTDGRVDILHQAIVAIDSSGVARRQYLVTTDENVIFAEGINAFPDLHGWTVDFVRLVVNDVSVSGANVQVDVTWQFYGSAPQFGTSGGGQRADVDAFLTYLNPIESRTTLARGKSLSSDNYSVRVEYGPTIDPASFEAELNRVDIGSSFNPVAGTGETVVIPIVPGRNVLRLSVEGQRTDGHTATDTDRLTINDPDY